MMGQMRYQMKNAQHRRMVVEMPVNDENQMIAVA